MDGIPSKVLVVDDEQDILDVLQYNFGLEGYEVETARSGEEALRKDLSRFQLLVLDVMMGGMSGLKVLMTIRQNPQTAHLPVILLTAKSSREDIIDGLRIGADDYVTKPFSIQELLLRARAILRRSATAEAQATKADTEPLTYGGLSLDLHAMELNVDGTPVPLAKTEFQLLALLMQNPSRVFSREQLLRGAWPDGVVVTERSVDVGITRLRKKIGPYAKCIVTRQGYGYSFRYE